MTTCRNVVADALVLAKVNALGDEPTAEESAMGLNALQAVYDHWANTLVSYTDVYKTVAYEAQEGERVYGSSITLPATILENGEHRKPRLYSMIQVVDTAKQTSAYDDGAWVRLDSLTLDTDAPFASLGRIGLAACLAEKWSEMFGGELTRGILMQARDFRSALTDAPETLPVQFTD